MFWSLPTTFLLSMLRITSCSGCRSMYRLNIIHCWWSSVLLLLSKHQLGHSENCLFLSKKNYISRMKASKNQLILRKEVPGVQKNLLEGVLGIFQKLLSMSRHLHEAYGLLSAVIRYIPLASLSPYLTNIFSLLFGRLTGSTKSTRNTVYFITLVAQFACQHGAPAAMAALDSVQPGSSLAIVRQVMVNNLPHVIDVNDIKVLSVGLTRILCETPALVAAVTLPSIPHLFVSVCGSQCFCFCRHIAYIALKVTCSQ